MTNSKKAKRFQFWINVVLILITLSIVLPFVLVFISSLTDENTLIRNGYSFFPEKFSFYAYSYIIRQGEKILRAYGITIFVTIVGTAANLAMSSLLAYPLSVKGLPYRRAITFFVFFTMLFNGGMTASYIIWTNIFGIKNTIWALLLPNYLMSGMNVLLVRNYYTGSIPVDILEAARIDGASELRIYSSIMLPLSKPVIITIAVFAGMAYWNDWSNAMYYITDQKLYSINAYLNNLQNNIKLLSMQSSLTEGANLQGLDLPSIGARMAIAMIAVLPVMIIFPFIQSQIIKGAVIGGVKG